MEFQASDRHKMIMNFIYQKPLYPEVCQQIDPETGKLKLEHMESCNGCALCEPGD